MVNNIEEIIWFREQPFVLLKNPLPLSYANHNDTEFAFMSSLQSVEKSVSIYEIELWIKWNGSDNCFQLIHVHENCIDVISSSAENHIVSLNLDQLHDYIHAYANSHKVPKNGLAYAINGIELALELSNNLHAYNSVGM
jgi:hypothetical protein